MIFFLHASIRSIIDFTENKHYLLHNKSQCDTLKWTNEGSIM